MSAQPTDTQPARPRIRDAEATKGRILDAAKKEFARNGLEGARVDAIALEANANKRMIYHYFESKEKLFQTVLENAYFDIRESEKKLELDSLDRSLITVLFWAKFWLTKFARMLALPVVSGLIFRVVCLRWSDMFWKSAASRMVLPSAIRPG